MKDLPFVTILMMKLKIMSDLSDTTLVVKSADISATFGTVRPHKKFGNMKGMLLKSLSCLH
jgi:hypothetical protein